MRRASVTPRCFPRHVPSRIGACVHVRSNKLRFIMPIFRFSPFILLSASVLFSPGVRGQATTPPTGPSPSTADPEHVISLDRIVVSSGFQDKTAFDLAQGTSILAGEQLHRQA